MAYVLKIKYEGSLRRLTLQKTQLGNEEFSFAQLETQIRELFQIPATTPMLVTYTDEESDVVTMANDQDLKDALVEQSLNPLRINVTLVNSSSKGTAASPIPNADADTETSVGGEADDADVLMKRFLRKLSLTPDAVKQSFQSYEPLFEGVTFPAQIPGLVENVMQTIASQISSAVKNGAAAASAAASSANAAAAAAGASATESGSDAFSAQPGKCPFADFAAAAASAASEPSKSDAQDGADAENVHHGVTCDSCGVNPIVGLRWKSNQKFDYDLCPSCFEKQGNEKEYTKIEEPKFRPRHFHGHGRMGSPFPPAFHPMCPPHFQGGKPGMGGPQSHPMFPPPHFHGGRPFGMRGPWGPGGRGHQWGAGVAGGGAFGGGKLDARFVCDVTVFDGTEIAPGTHFTKIWRLRNSGSIPWPQQTSLVHAGGDELGQVSMVPLEIPEQGLAPESEMEVSVDLVAPEKSGRYLSHWRLASPAGPKFGHRLSVLVQVVPKETLDRPASSLAVDDDAPTQEPESAADIVLQETGESSADGGDVTKQEAFVTVEDESSIRGGAEAETAESKVEEAEQKDVPSAVESGNSSGLFSMLGGTLVNPAIDTSDELVASPVVAEKEAEDVTPIPATAPPSDENTFFKLSDDEKETVATPSTADEESPAVVEEGSITYPVLEVTRDQGPITYPVVDAAPGNVDSEVAKGDDLSTPTALAGKLQAMGFTDAKLNLELLEKNNMDLRKTLDDLCSLDDWDSILEELEEMGFYDAETNRRLMFKNNGSVKRVVKELVQMYRDPQGKREKVE